MSNTTERPAFWDMVKNDAGNAGYRIAAVQTTKATKAGILALLSKQGSDNKALKAIEEMMETEYGFAIISMILGLSLTKLPIEALQDPRVQRLAEELRINSMSTAGNELIGTLTEMLMPVIASALMSIPEETNSRVATSDDSEESYSEEIVAGKQAIA